MASNAKRSRVTFTAEQVAEIYARNSGDELSEIDSECGGISSEEESDLDAEMEDGSWSNSEPSDSEVPMQQEMDEEEQEEDQGEDQEEEEEPSVSEGSGSDEEHIQGQMRARGRGRGRARGRGRVAARARGLHRQGRGGNVRGRGRACDGVVSNQQQAIGQCYSYDDQDNAVHPLPPFTPRRPPGLHLPNAQMLRGSMTRAVDFFKLFFTDFILLQIVEHTNTYGWGSIERKQYYSDSDGAWINTDQGEIERLIALVIYFSLVNVTSIHRYWSSKTLYHGLWARKIMPRDRFKALMAMLHVVDPDSEERIDKIRKVRSFVDAFKEKCKELYQPFQRVAVDERMVKSKHRSGIRQNMKNKPTKWGIKLWVIADSINGYTYDFDVYIGRNNNEPPSEHGLGYDVVMKLVNPLINQGYHIYFDNFYTSPRLVSDLFSLGLPSCGTTAENRRGFPESMKQGKVWGRKKERGSMRWVREGEVLALQWNDNRPVTMLSSIHNACEFVYVERKEKVDQRWQVKQVKQPITIQDYNKYMNAVDRSDQMISKNSVLRKCMRWWKTLFFHLVDIAVINSYLLFRLHRAEHPDNVALKRNRKYTIVEYREELVRQLAGIEEYGQPPVLRPPKKVRRDFSAVHIPRYSKKKRNCRVCYDTTKTELNISQNKNCFEVWHNNNYHK